MVQLSKRMLRLIYSFLVCEDTYDFRRRVKKCNDKGSFIFKEINMDRQRLSHGFYSGVNNITITKILKWQNNSNINWNAFLWYITDYATIVDFGENWFKVNIISDKQLNFFYHKVIEYQSDICQSNYDTDIQNELWKDHKKGVERNLQVLLRLSK